MIPLGFQSRIHWTVLDGGWISQYTCASRTRRAMSWVYCDPKSMIRMPSWCFATARSPVWWWLHHRGTEVTEVPCARMVSRTRHHQARWWVAPGTVGHLAVERQEIAGLAHGADHVGADPGAVERLHFDDFVIGLVVTRPDQVVHSRVDHHELLPARVL